MSWGYRFILIHRRWSMNIYQHLDPFRMNMCVPTYITCQPIWPTAIQPELLTLQKIATKSIPGPSQETVQAWGFLHGSSSCSVFLCRLLQSWPIRIRETVCFCSSSIVCDFNANLLILCSSCPPVQLLPSPQLLITGKISHQTGMAMTRAETSGSG